MTTKPGGYLIEYNLVTDIPGAEGQNAFEALVRDVQPPQVMSRWRNAVNGKLSGKRTRLGMQLEEARMFSFISEEHVPQLDLVQWDGPHVYNFYSVMLQDEDGSAWGEYHRVIGEMADVETAPTQAEGGQNYTYKIYVNTWQYRDVPQELAPAQGWLLKNFDFVNERFHERRLVRGAQYRGYAGTRSDTPVSAPGSFRELVRNHNQLLGRTG